MLEAFLGLFGHRALENILNLLRDSIFLLDDGHRLLVDDVIENGGRRVSWKRPAAGEKLVENTPRREDIGSSVELLTPDLLRRHVVNRSYHHAAFRDLVAPFHTSDPEIHDLDLPVVQTAKVGRLDVAMDNTVLVGEVESATKLDDDIERLRNGHAFVADEARDVHTL